MGILAVTFWSMEEKPVVVVKNISSNRVTVDIKDRWDCRLVMCGFFKTDYSIPKVGCVGNNDRKPQETSCIVIVCKVTRNSKHFDSQQGIIKFSIYILLMYNVPDVRIRKTFKDEIKKK